MRFTFGLVVERRPVFDQTGGGSVQAGVGLGLTQRRPGQKGQEPILLGRIDL